MMSLFFLISFDIFSKPKTLVGIESELADRISNVVSFFAIFFSISVILDS